MRGPSRRATPPARRDPRRGRRGAPARPRLAVGGPRMVRGELGTVRFVGGVHYARGDHVGIELDDASGKNDGAVKWRRVLCGAPKHGLFVRESEVEMLQ